MLNGFGRSFISSIVLRRRDSDAGGMVRVRDNAAGGFRLWSLSSGRREDEKGGTVRLRYDVLCGTRVWPLGSGSRDHEKGGGTVRGREGAADADGGDNASSETRVSSLRGNLIGSTHVAELGLGDVTVRRATRRGYEAISSARPVWRSSAQGDVTVRRATMRRAARYGCETMVQARLVFLHSARGDVTTRRAARCGCDAMFLRDSCLVTRLGGT